MFSNFIALIKEDMKPAYGVTEPAAIALACAQARSLTKEFPIKISVFVNSGIFKNAFACGIPNTTVIGNEFAAALGCWFGSADRGLMVLDETCSEDVEFCRKMIQEGNVEVVMSNISSEISIEAHVYTQNDHCEAKIMYTHTNVCFKRKNGKVLQDECNEPEKRSDDRINFLKSRTLKEMYAFAENIDIEKIRFIKEAFNLNLVLSEAALRSSRCILSDKLMHSNKGLIISDSAIDTAILLSASATEARVLGLSYPAMSITGSGNHGIICTMPLYAFASVEGYSTDNLLRATALSYLVTIYIKNFSGALSALCGCAVAAGTGMACGMTMLRGGKYEAVEKTLYNMANSIVGMICQGGNHGCVMKVISAVTTAFVASNLGLSGVQVDPQHGIGDITPEQTMRNIGLIANPGMQATEETILNIITSKQNRKCTNY